MAQKLENRANLFRIQILIIDGGLLALRNKIDQTLTAQGITLSACLNNERTTINGLKSRRIITQVQYDQLFPTSGPVPTTSDMDITLIICLLRNLKCFGLNKKFDWNATPISTDVSVEADICRLKAYRNEISHIAETTVIQANDFATWWNDIEQILIRLCCPALNIQHTIAGFKVCPLDPEEEKRVQEEMEKWEDFIDHLREDVTGVTERVTEVEKTQEEIKRRLDEGVSSMQTEEEKHQKHDDERYQKRKKDEYTAFKTILDEALAESGRGVSAVHASMEVEVHHVVQNTKSYITLTMRTALAASFWLAFLMHAIVVVLFGCISIGCLLR